MIRSAKTKWAHRDAGSVLGLILVVLFILILVGCVAISAYMFWSREKRGEGRTESKAMEIANALNENDRVGQMNYVVARSRELVYLSRETEQKLYSEGDNNRAWVALARQLCDEARAGAGQVEAERRHQIALSKETVDTYAYRFNSESKTRNPIVTAFWKSTPTSIDQVNLGWVRNTESNVQHPDTWPALHEFDQSKGYFQKSSNLYRGNINAKLPSPDDDLDFKLSSLAAPVDGEIAPVRLIKAANFMPGATCYKDGAYADVPLDQIPSAIYVKQKMTVTVQKEAPQDFPLEAHCATRSAEPPPM